MHQHVTPAILFALFLGILLFPFAGHTAPAYYAFVEGAVYEQTSSGTTVPLKNATIAIPEQQFSTTTDDHGVFLLGIALTTQRATLTIRAEKTGIGSVTITNVHLGAGFMRRFSLKITSGTHTTTAEASSESARIPEYTAPPVYTLPTAYPQHTFGDGQSNSWYFQQNPPGTKSFTGAWMFLEQAGWTNDRGYGYGEGDHFGDDYYARDYNWQTGNDDEGKMLFAAMPGTVVYVKNDYPACTRNVCWYGNQVVIQHGNTATRYTHLQHVYVKEGQQVNILDPVGTLGYSGLSGRAPYSAHLHFVFYQNLDHTSRRIDTATGSQQPASYWLPYGGIPECMMVCHYPTQFAAKFSLSKAMRVDKAPTMIKGLGNTHDQRAIHPAGLAIASAFTPEPERSINGFILMHTPTTQESSSSPDQDVSSEHPESGDSFFSFLIHLLQKIF